MKDGWTLVIFTHALYAVSTSTNQMYVISQSFVDTIYHYQGKGRIACVLMGHSHVDRIHIGNTGVPYIISQCDRTEPYHGHINVLRVPGTISENHFEVVLIDKKKQEVRLYSIGSDARDGVDDEVDKTVDLRVELLMMRRIVCLCMALCLAVGLSAQNEASLRYRGLVDLEDGIAYYNVPLCLDRG